MDDTKKITISKKLAKKLLCSSDGELRQIALDYFPELKSLPKNYDDLIRVDGFYTKMDDNFNVEIIKYSGFNVNKETGKPYRGVYKTQEQAVASIAFAQLTQLRDIYRRGWLPNYHDMNEDRYPLCPHKDGFVLGGTSYPHFFTFQSYDVAKLFLENFKELLEKAKPLFY